MSYGSFSLQSHSRNISTLQEEIKIENLPGDIESKKP
jgi:hypothetical protein